MIGKIHQPELSQQLRQEESRLSELEAQHKSHELLEETKLKRELTSIALQKKILADGIKSSKELAEKVRQSNLNYIKGQQENLNKTRERYLAFGKKLQARP